MWKTITIGKTWKGIFKNRKKDGQYYWCNCIISPVSQENGQLTNFLVIQEDVTEKKHMEEDIIRLTNYASYDGLTGLLNRTRFMELVNDWILYAKIKNYKG